MKNQVQQLLDAGQSVWLDNVRRSMFASGELDRLIEKGLRGMTSNPTIFEKAIGAGTDYDEQLSTLIGTDQSADSLFWDLAIQDIQSACDAFKSVFESSGGNDGFVSLEVSPLLAHDTQGTIAMVKELWERVNRPNVMIKIPGTKEGLPAIEESIYRGYNINVTLIFSVEMYETCRTRLREGTAAACGRGQADRQDPLRELGLRQPHRHGRRQAPPRPDRQRREARPPARQDRYRRTQADVSDVQGGLRGRRFRPAAREGRRGAAAAVGLDVDEESSLSRPDVRRERRRTGHGQHDAARHAGRTARSRQRGPRHRRGRPARSRRRYARPAGGEDLALRRHARPAGRRRQALLRLLCGAARRDRVQTEAAGVGRGAAGAPRAREARRRLRDGARPARERRFPQADLGARRDVMVERRRRHRHHQEVPGLARHPAAHARGSGGAARVCGQRQGTVRVRRRLRHGRQFAGTRHPRRHVRTQRRLSAALRARLDVPGTDQGARSADRHPIDAVRHLEQERHDHRAQRLLLLLPRKGLEGTRSRDGGAQLRRDHGSRNEARQGGAGRVVRRRFRKRPQHRWTLLRALVRRHRAVGDRRLRRELVVRSSPRRDARQRPHRRPAQRAGRALRRGDRRPCRGRTRQADDRHAQSGQGVRRVGGATGRRIHRQTRQGNRPDRGRAARRARRLRRRPHVRLRRRESPRSRTGRRREAARARGRGPSRHPPRHERPLRPRRAVLPLGDRRRRSGRHPRHQRLRSAQRTGVEGQYGRAARAVRAQRQLRRAEAQRRGSRV